MKPLDLREKFDGLDIEKLIVLDLGCGTYSSPLSSQMRDLSFHWLISVDRHAPVIKKLNDQIKRNPFKAHIHTTRVKDARKFLAEAEMFTGTPNPEPYDVIIFMDMIEHLSKSDGIAILERAKSLSPKRILIWIPLDDCPQDALEGNPHQIHKSTWSKEDLEQLGFTVTVFKDFHQHFDPPVSAAWAVWNNEPVETILVDRLDVHGDVLVATSVLPGLKTKYPDAKIDWHVRRGYDFALLENPWINKIIQGPIKGLDRSRYDLVVSPDHHMQWNRPMAKIHCDDAGVPLNKPRLYFKDSEFRAVPKKYIGAILVANKAGWHSRVCPNLNEALKELSEFHDFVQIDNGKDLYEGIDHPKLTLRQAAAYMSYADLYIGIDTVFMHMAVAFDKPMVLCMGPTGPKTQYIPDSTVVRPFDHKNPAEPHPDFQKGIDLPVDTIITAIRTKLDEKGKIVNKKPRRKLIEYITRDYYDTYR